MKKAKQRVGLRGRMAPPFVTFPSGFESIHTPQELKSLAEDASSGRSIGFVPLAEIQARIDAADADYEAKLK